MVKIVHAADFHLDSAFVGLTEEKARQRRRESRENFRRLARLVREEEVDLVLLAGDLFDGQRVYPETLECLRETLGEMECPVFIAPGNHDPYTPSSPYAGERWPENVHIFRSESLTAVELPELNCVVHGAAFTSQQRQSEALAGGGVPADGKLHLLCLHGDVTAADSRYGRITKDQIAVSGLDYLALGHVHQFSGLQQQGGVTWAYPGCPEGRGFDELGDKGVLIGTVERGSVQLEFKPLCSRRYRVIRMDVTDMPIRQAMESVVSSVAVDDICRVIFTGETDEVGVDLGALERDYAHRFYVLQLRDETCVSRGIWDRAGEDSLRGLFLSEMRGRYDSAADEAERKKITLAVRFGLAALDGRDMG